MLLMASLSRPGCPKLSHSCFPLNWSPESHWALLNSFRLIRNVLMTSNNKKKTIQLFTNHKYVRALLNIFIFPNLLSAFQHAPDASSNEWFSCCIFLYESKYFCLNLNRDFVPMWWVWLHDLDIWWHQRNHSKSESALCRVVCWNPSLLYSLLRLLPQSKNHLKWSNTIQCATKIRKYFECYLCYQPIIRITISFWIYFLMFEIIDVVEVHLPTYQDIFIEGINPFSC